MNATFLRKLKIISFLGMIVFIWGCPPNTTNDDVDKFPPDNSFEDGNSKKKRSTNKAGYVEYTWDNDGKLTESTFHDTSGTSQETTRYVYENGELDSIVKGGTTWPISRDMFGICYVQRYLGVGLFEQFEFHTELGTGNPDTVYIYEKRDTLPYRKITFQYTDENMTKMTIEQDDDLDGEFELLTTIEYEYDSGKNPNKGNPDNWRNPYGGADWSENNVTKIKTTDAGGNVSMSERTYEYNDFGYPTSITANGKTTVYEYDCE